MDRPVGSPGEAVQEDAPVTPEEYTALEPPFELPEEGSKLCWNISVKLYPSQ